MFFFNCELLYVTTMEQWNYNCSPYSSCGPNSSTTVNPQLNHLNSSDHTRSSTIMPVNSHWNSRNYNALHPEAGKFPQYSAQITSLKYHYQSSELTEQQKWLKLNHQRQIDQQFLNDFCRSRREFLSVKQEPIIKVFQSKTFDVTSWTKSKYSH